MANPAQSLEGWLFDAYPGTDGMVLWVQDADGRPHRVISPYRPGMYFSGGMRGLDAASRALAPLNVPATIRPAVQRELMSGEEIGVFRVSVGSPLAFPQAARLLARIPGLTLYNCDIPTNRLFFYETGLFPLARCRVEVVDGVAKRIDPLTHPEDLEYDLPPLLILRVRLVPYTNGDATISPAHGRRGLLEIGVDGETVVVASDDPAECIRSMNRMLARYDPDVILTEWGDPFLIPRLRELAARAGLPLALNRDAHRTIRTRRSRSYMTYGQVVYQAGAQMLYGRWHLDLHNSFIYGEAELAGLMEVARLSGIPVQDQARTSTGTAISSMQIQRAVRDGILIPWQKAEPEGFKTAAELIVSDKGGLTYQPLVGLYEQVGELDFSSMYPTMMAKFNISPETIGCECCPDSRVPEIHYSVCRKRRGLVPRVLDHLLERRLYYKRRKHETVGRERALYDQRQNALKWCLVTCLDQETLVLYRRADHWAIATIQEIVDRYLPGPEWGVVPVQDLAVTGIDQNLHGCVKRVKQVIKSPAPPKMIQIKAQWGRTQLMIPDHQCYVLENGQLVVKPADELKPGDWLPIATGLEGVVTERLTQIDVMSPLKKRLTLDEQHVWRVFGEPIRLKLHTEYEAIRSQGRRDYTAKTIWNWREYGYLPLHYVHPESFTEAELKELAIGRGKREGGVIQRLPALLDLDEELGFLLGFFVGDGSISGNMMRFAIGANEAEHLDYLSDILRSKFGVRSRAYRERRAQMHVLQANSVGLIQVFERALGIGKTAESGKLHVPELILNGPFPLQRGFILGLIASDGHVSRSRNFASIASASQRFISEVSWLLTMLGVDHRLAHHGRLHQVQTRNLDETSKLFYPNAPGSDKHHSKWRDRLSLSRLPRVPQVPSGASGLLEMCRAARVARIPRISDVTVISKSVAQTKLIQLQARAHKLPSEIKAKLPQLEALLGSSLIFARILSVEEVSTEKPFVYCFQLEDEPAAFFVEGGILTHNSFGYLGYRNARFGRIEAHEAVTAYSREKLLHAKEIAEHRGYRMLHALVDSMWLQRPGATRDDYESLAQEVTGATGLPIFVEGVYRWLGFLPSKLHKGVGVPNRYMGVFDDGTTKVRGIEVRRSDVPAIVESTQTRMLQRMFACTTLAEIRAALPEILAILEAALVRLRTGEVTPEELVVTTHLSQEVSEYRHNTVQAITARTLDRHGARLHPGEAVQYIITDRTSKIPEDRARPYTLLGSDWSYDAGAYADMLTRSGETILELFGFTRDRLSELYSTLHRTAPKLAPPFRLARKQAGHP